jgi:hypothetical protein
MNGLPYYYFYEHGMVTLSKTIVVIIVSFFLSLSLTQVMVVVMGTKIETTNGQS